MNSRKVIMIISIIIVALVIVLLGLLLGRHVREDNVAITGPVDSGGGKAVAAYLNACQSVPASNADTDAAVIEELLLDNMRCHVEQSRADGASLSVSAPDMHELIDRIDGKATSEADFARLLRDALQNGEFTMRAVTVEVSLDANGNLCDGYALTDAIYGGMLSKMEAMLWKGVIIS